MGQLTAASAFPARTASPSVHSTPWGRGAVALCEVGTSKIGNLGWLDRHDQLVEGSQDP
jgi:hypothetical protein